MMEWGGAFVKHGQINACGEFRFFEIKIPGGETPPLP